MMSNARRLLCFALFAAAIPHVTHAQTPLESSLVTPYLRNVSAAVWEDLDGDGLEDLLVGTGSDALIAWSKSLANGEFETYRIVDTVPNGVDNVLAFDVDSDGVIDIVAHDFVNQDLIWFRGLGEGSFEDAAVVSSSVVVVRFLRTSDIDLDGDLDLVMSGDAAQGVVWYPNLGGIFGAPITIATGSVAGAVRGIDVGDVDMDGDDDVVFGTFQTRDVLFVENQGAGTFAAPTPLGLNLQGIQAVAFGDLDGDGQLDIAASGSNEVVWVDRPSATSLAWAEQDRAPIGAATRGLITVDTDGDGADEVVVTQLFSLVDVYSVDAATSTFITPAFGFFLRSEVNPVAADVDRDGLMDLIGVADQGTVARGMPGGGFDDPTSIVSPFRGITTYSRVDVDGDGDQDVVAATSYDIGAGGGTIVLHERLTDAVFGGPREIADANTTTYQPTATDLNGDGNPDLTFVRSDGFSSFDPSALKVRDGNGDGTFGPEREIWRFPMDLRPDRPAEPIDIDADGDLDLLVFLVRQAPSVPSRLYLLRNDGTGQFAAPLVVAEADDLRYQGLADMDGDGVLDLLTSTSTVAARIFPGDTASATGFGTPYQTAGTPSGQTIRIAAIDFDVDGDKDLICHIDPLGMSNDWLVIYRRLATGFGNEQFRTNVRLTEAFGTVIDWDLDGDEDFVYAERFAGSVLWLESKAGAFMPPAIAVELPAGEGFGGSKVVRMSDADGDGDVDLWVELDRQLRLVRNVTELGAEVCSGTPNSTGVPGRLIASGTGDASTNQLVLTGSDLPPGAATLFLVSRMTGMTQPPLSQGTLCLGGSIGRYVGPGQVQIASAAGVSRLSLDLTMTPDPALGVGPAVAGETLFFQAWHRDLNPMPTSNLTSAIEVLLQ